MGLIKFTRACEGQVFLLISNNLLDQLSHSDEGTPLSMQVHPEENLFLCRGPSFLLLLMVLVGVSQSLPNSLTCLPHPLFHKE